MKETIDQEIQSIREELKTLKEKTRHYDGKNAKNSLKRPNDEVIKEIKKEEKEEEEREREEEKKERKKRRAVSI